MGLVRSSSVSATAVEEKAAAVTAKAWWGWHFPSPLKAFRHRRSSASMPE
ncbi:Os02g0255900 [Oryza sativa Japonica Group]|nr:Os02g0255900 [Oryza sativa Japonica Group]